MIIHNCQQGTDEWRKVRVGIPTASCFGKIIKASTMKKSDQRSDYMYELVEELLTGEPKETYSSKAMERGTRLEPEAINNYSFMNDIEVDQVGFITDDKGNYGASPDGLLGKNGGLETKCPNLKTHHGYIKAKRLPNLYKPQVLGGILVAEKDYWDFKSYFPCAIPFEIRVHREDYEKDIEILKYELLEFCYQKNKLYNELRAA